MIHARGRYRNQAVELAEPLDLPEGTEVEVEVEVEPVELRAALAALSEGLRTLAGQARDLPDDLARNHDHYLHGQPRR